MSTSPNDQMSAGVIKLETHADFDRALSYVVERFPDNFDVSLGTERELILGAKQLDDVREFLAQRLGYTESREFTVRFGDFSAAAGPLTSHTDYVIGRRLRPYGSDREKIRGIIQDRINKLRA
jgi:hypothetical protein